MKRALRELGPGEPGPLPEEMLEPQLSGELCRLSLHSYDLAPLYLDLWGADFRSLQVKLDSLKIRPSEMLHLIDPERLAEAVAYWESLEEEGRLSRSRSRLIFPFQLRPRRERMEETKKDMDISRKNRSSIREHLDGLAEKGPDSPRIADVRELRQSMHDLEERMDALLRLGRLDIEAWGERYRDEYHFVSRRHGDIGKRLLELLSNN